jgi:hypothetical protein
MARSHTGADLSSPCRLVDHPPSIVFGALSMLQLVFLVCLVVAAPGLAVRAQPATQGAGSASAASAIPQVSPDEARRALEVLKDPQKRAQLTSTLETIARTLPQIATDPASAVTPASARASR